MRENDRLMALDHAPIPRDIHRAWRRQLREEDAWLLRQIAGLRPVLWLRPHALGPAARQGILALKVGQDGMLRGALRSQAGAWPWADGTVPAIVLQHVNEGGGHGAALLAEAARVLAPEGRLYVLRFDHFSPWYWRYGRHVGKRAGAPALGLPIDLRPARARGLALEFRHHLGARGVGVAAGRPPRPARAEERWPFAGVFRAARIWVLRKRRSGTASLRPLRTAPAHRPGYRLAVARRLGSGAGRA